ncbi:hypothetical protein TURU_019382 [Turdus rufiventris]|nr:hypothetical protein TURU_019382 [Turdus rufiventris]
MKSKQMEVGDGGPMKTEGGAGESPTPLNISAQKTQRTGVKWSHIEAEYGGLLWLLAEQERTVLGRLAELDHTLAAAQAEKSLRLARGVAQLHRLIGQLEDRCLPQDVGAS